MSAIPSFRLLEESYEGIIMRRAEGCTQQAQVEELKRLYNEGLESLHNRGEML